MRYPLQAEFRFSRFEIGREAHAYLIVSADHVGHNRSRLLATRVNLDGPRARTDTAKYLLTRCDCVGDWGEMVEDAYTCVLSAVQEGDPVLRIMDVGPRQESIYRLYPFVLEKMPTILFGHGGQGKTTLAYMLGIMIQSGVSWAGLDSTPGNVMICDWETDEVTAREVLERLANGMEIGDTPEMWNLHYKACYSPLMAEAEAIGRYIDQNDISVVIVDSLGSACGGDKNSQEVATRMHNAMRAWRTSVIGIDHVAKDQNGKANTTPFGSIYFQTNSRSVWRVVGAKDGDNVLHQGVHHTKANFGEQPSRGFQYTFSPDNVNCDTITVTAEEPKSDVKIAKASIRESVWGALQDARQASTLDDIMEAAGLEPRQRPQVTSRLKELVEDGYVVRIDIRGAARKWAITSKREEVEAG